MFESKLVQDLLLKKDPLTPEGKELRINEIINLLESTKPYDNPYFKHKLSKEDMELMETINRKLNRLDFRLTGLLLLTIIFIILFASSLDKDFSFVIIAVAITYLTVNLFSGFFSFLILNKEEKSFVDKINKVRYNNETSFFIEESYEKQRSLIQESYKKQQSLLDTTKELIQLLLDKPYEVRVELLESCDKIKVVVEKNLFIDGTNSVIKTSPESLTAYVDILVSHDKIIKACVEIVKQVELKFNK